MAWQPSIQWCVQTECWILCFCIKIWHTLMLYINTVNVWEWHSWVCVCCKGVWLSVAVWVNLFMCRMKSCLWKKYDKFRSLTIMGVCLLFCECVCFFLFVLLTAEFSFTFMLECFCTQLIYLHECVGKLDKKHLSFLFWKHSGLDIAHSL